MNPSKFFGTKETIQVGGLDTSRSVVLAADTASTAFTSDIVVEVSAYSGLDTWVAIGTDPTATAATNGNAFIAGGTTTRPFRLEAGDKIIATQAISIAVVG